MSSFYFEVSFFLYAKMSPGPLISFLHLYLFIYLFFFGGAGGGAFS